MADTWISDLTHFLDEAGDIVSAPASAKALAEYFTSIVFMASFPDPEYPPEYRVMCRRRPSHQPCLTEIIGFVDPETDDIMWKCPKCNDRGIISNWRGTMWDLSDSGDVAH